MKHMMAIIETFQLTQVQEYNEVSDWLDLSPQENHSHAAFCLQEKNILVTHGIIGKTSTKKLHLASLGSYIEENMSVSEFLYKVYTTRKVIMVQHCLPNHSQLLGSDCEIK